MSYSSHTAPIDFSRIIAVASNPARLGRMRKLGFVSVSKAAFLAIVVLIGFAFHIGAFVLSGQSCPRSIWTHCSHEEAARVSLAMRLSSSSLSRNCKSPDSSVPGPCAVSILLRKHEGPKSVESATDLALVFPAFGGEPEVYLR